MFTSVNLAAARFCVILFPAKAMQQATFVAMAHRGHFSCIHGTFRELKIIAKHFERRTVIENPFAAQINLFPRRGSSRVEKLL